MNKLKRLMKRLGVEAAVIVAILAGLGGAMMLTNSMANAGVEKLKENMALLEQDRAQLAAMRSQLDRSGEAEKRFVEIQLDRSNVDFSSSTEALKDWARDAKVRYRFANNFKLNLPPQKLSDNPVLSALDYDIVVREGVGMELETISDLHVYSFLSDLQRSAPGFVRLTAIEVERKADINSQSVAQMVGGMAPTLVAAKIKFLWVGVNEKEAAPVVSITSPATAPIVNPAPGALP